MQRLRDHAEQCIRSGRARDGAGDSEDLDLLGARNRTTKSSLQSGFDISALFEMPAPATIATLGHHDFAYSLPEPPFQVDQQVHDDSMDDLFSIDATARLPDTAVMEDFDVQAVSRARMLVVWPLISVARQFRPGIAQDTDSAGLPSRLDSLVVFISLHTLCMSSADLGSYSYFEQPSSLASSLDDTEVKLMTNGPNQRREPFPIHTVYSSQLQDDRLDSTPTVANTQLTPAYKRTNDKNDKIHPNGTWPPNTRMTPHSRLLYTPVPGGTATVVARAVCLSRDSTSSP